jgi:hypothetical protein
MEDIVKFGEDVVGYPIPVLNEREIRASAGLLFLAVLTSFFFAVLKQNFIPIKYVITVFLADFLVRVFVNPKYAPTLIVGRLIVRNQVPEYVGAKQKKFAWIIGVVLASVMFVHLVVVNAYGPISGLVCLSCMIFLFFESAFGICLGCKVYPMIYKEKAQFCPGEVCDPKARQDIQKTSLPQILIVLGFIAGIVFLAAQFHGAFSKQPHELFVSSRSVHVK